MRSFTWLLSPWLILLLTWSGAIAVYLYVSAVPGQYPYLEYMISSEQTTDHATVYSYVFLLIQFSVFCCGCVAALVMTTAGSAPQMGMDESTQHAMAQRLVKATGLTGLVAMAWLLGAMLELGGPANLMALAANENQVARQTLHAASFPGGRLLSYGFIGIAVLAAALLGRVSQPMLRRRLWVILLVALVFLGAMPVLVSGRINFVMACVAAVMAYALSAGRLPPMKLLVGSLVALGLVWTLKETFVMGHVSAAADLSAQDQAFEGGLFYVYNDVLNALNAPVVLGDSRTWGWYSTRFVFFMTFTDRAFLQSIADDKASIAGWLTAGEVPLLSAPFVDFGWAGGMVLLALGFICTYCHRRAMLGPRQAAVYGLLATGLLVSTHSSYITSQEVVYNLMLCLFLGRSMPRGGPKPLMADAERSRALQAASTSAPGRMPVQYPG